MIQDMKIGEFMSILFDDCYECPLEKVCDGFCEEVWAGFFGSKVKEEGLIKEETNNERLLNK